ncbi:hypothetical protein I3843_13G137800 [Carya illinoinensis]|nr:hypothetical protein I3843_13G137800 [Carya illinoinensis]
MAEKVLFNVAAQIIQSLGSQALEEIGLLWGVTDELEKLKNTVSTIQAVLLDAEEQSAVKHQVRDWLEKLKDVFYDADDLLDGFSTEHLLREMMTRDKMPKKVRTFFSKSNQLVCDFKMGHKIKAIRQKLDAISNDRTKFHFNERPVEIGVRARKRDDAYSFLLKAEDVIGREDDKKEIINKLLSDSNVRENVGILPITGIGGLGKTTLAQLIFNDLKVREHFQLKMWVCVSDNFDVRKVVEKILESATQQKPNSVEMDTLVNGLQKEIGGKKYLLVLDDVWNEEVGKWDELKKLLMSGASGSRILVTTRSAKVAKITQTIFEPYSLQGLDTQKSRSLFEQVAFKNGKGLENSRKVEVGLKIVEKCSGVPLVIKTIGSLLSLKDSEAEWVSFEKNKLPETKENTILPTLKLSYDQLPSHLKQCFAYCSIFPKDYVMKKSRLINLWIAQGFISNQNECLEDVGHEYFMDLLSGSFFQEAEMDDWGNVSTIKMHDFMHDLAMSEAGSLITRLESKSEKKIIGDQKTRHVSFVNNIDFSFVISTSSSKASKTRTLLCLGGLWNLGGCHGTSCEAIFSSLKFLRVLDLHGKQLDLVPSSICKLKHLRDLDLSWNHKIKKLPDSISRLQNLYTLGLLACSRLEELPREITKLVNLRHLYNGGCKTLTYMPRGLGQLTNLQTLSEFVVHSDSASKDSCRLSELNRLNSLRGELLISGLRHDGEDIALDCKGANLKEKEHLQALHLRWRSGANFINARDENMALEGLEPHPNLKKLYIYNYGGVRVPMWFMSLTNLVHLTLSSCGKLKYLPPLSRLPSLKSLTLAFLSEIEYVSDCSDNNELSSFSSSAEFFPSLESIALVSCGNLKGWWRSDSYNVDVNTTDHENSFETPSITWTGHALLLLPSFPRLSKLKVELCTMLTSLPMFPHLEEELYLSNARWKPVQQTITNASSSSASSTPIAFSSPPLSKLKTIFLHKIEDLETLPEDGLQNLISLQHLSIAECRRLKSLSQGVQYLTALQKLELFYCPVLDLGNDEHGMQWKGLKSLISLEFKGIPKLVSLPSGLQHVTTLRELQISNCPMLDLGNGMQWKGLKSLISLEFDRIPKLVSLPLGLQHVTTIRELKISHCSSLMAIPEWIRNWSSLEQFTISECSGLTSLPEAMSRLTSLKMLEIRYCPILKRRCEQERGEDWPKIARIPERHLI